MKKLLFVPLFIIVAMAMSLVTVVGTTSCSSPKQDSIKAAQAKADSLARLVSELKPGFNLKALGEAKDFKFDIVDVKGVCQPDKKILYLVLDSINYETNVVSVKDSAWTNVVSIDTATMVVSFGPEATITAVYKKPMKTILEEINAQYDKDVEAATKVAKAAADKAVYRENSMEGDGNYRLGSVVPRDLQDGKFKYEIKDYYPVPRGGMGYFGSRYKTITVKRDGDHFSVK